MESEIYVVEQNGINKVLEAFNTERKARHLIDEKELENANLIDTRKGYKVIIRNIDNLDGHNICIRKRAIDLMFDNCDLDNDDRIYIETTNDITINNCTLRSFNIEKNHQGEIYIFNSYIEYLEIDESVLRRIKLNNSIIDFLKITHSILPHGLRINYKSSIGKFKLYESLIDNTSIISYNRNSAPDIKLEDLYEENIEDIVKEEFVLSNSLIIENNVDTYGYPITDKYLNKNKYEKVDGLFICGVYKNNKSNKNNNDNDI